MENKKLIFLLCMSVILLLPFISFAQTDNRTPEYRFWGVVGINTQGYLTLKDTAHYALQVGDSTLGKGMIMPIGITADIPPTKAGLVYQLSDSSIYYSNGSSWTKIGGSGASVPVLSNISAMQLYSGLSPVVYVSDSLEGGLFYYNSNSLYVDNGIIFSATGLGSGVWERSYNKNLGVNAEWYGMNPYDKIADQTSINNALSSPYSRGIVNIGDYPGNDTIFISSSILMPSDVSLNIGKKTHVALTNAANSYIIRNLDTLGNSNIKIDGGNFFCNGLNQTIVIGSNALNSFYGFSMLFLRCKNVFITNVQMDTSFNYYIYLSGNTNARVTNSSFYSKPGTGANGCSVGFSGNGLILNNLRGYTNDDFITVISGQNEGSAVQWNFLADQIPTNNINISDIHLENSPSDGSVTYSSMGIWSERYSTNPNGLVSNVYLNNINGDVGYGFIRIGSLQFGPGYFSNININNISGTIHTALGNNDVVVLGDISSSNLATYFDNVNVNNVSVVAPPTNYIRGVVLDNLSNFKTINVSNFSIIQGGYSVSASVNPIIYDDAYELNILNLNNCANIDTLYPSRYIYSNNSNDQTDIRHINFSNCSYYNNYPANFGVANAGEKISVNGTSLFMPISSVSNPESGDIVKDPTNGISIYLNGRWQNWIPNLITSPISGQILTYNGVNWINSNQTASVNLANSNLKQTASTLRNYNLNGGTLTFVDSTLFPVIPPFGNAHFSNDLDVLGGYSPYNTHYANALIGSNGGSDTLNSRLVLTAANLGTFTGAFMSQLTLDTLGLSFAASSPVTTVFNVDKRGDGRFYGNLGIVGDSLTIWPKTYIMTSPTIQSFQTRFNSSMNLTALDSVTAPVSGLDMYTNSLSLELDNTSSIQASGVVNTITAVRGSLGLNMSGTTTKLWSANANIAGIVGTVSIFNNANYENISAIAAASPFSYTQGTYTKFTGTIDTSSQLYLQGNPGSTYNIDATISNPYGIYQASSYPNRFSGGIQMPIRVVTASTTVTTSDYTVVSASGTNTFTIPAASTCGRQVFHFICNTGTVTLSVGYLNYSGTSTTTIAAGSGVTIQSNGTSYYQIGQ